MLNRRNFLTGAVAGMAAAATRASVPAAADTAWRKGHFQVHFIYTGVAESMLILLPDGTSALLDCGDHAAITRVGKSVPVMPGPQMLAGDWIARYVLRNNPSAEQVDYMILSHFHADHCGTSKWRSERLPPAKGSGPFGAFGRAPCHRSGFGLAAETLRFGTAIDRGWPDYDEPIPLRDGPDGELDHMKRLYAWLQKRDGLKIEKFRLGAKDQIVPRKDPAACAGFEAFNLCANGKIACADGSVKDLYADVGPARVKHLNENGMSLGHIFRYGAFSFFTAGDFSDRRRRADGSTSDIEAELAPYVPRVSVAKINHHGHHSMSSALVKALAPRVWTACIWDQWHVTPDTFARLTDRGSYPDARTVLPGYLPNDIRALAPAARADVPEAVWKPVHLVLDVPPGGATYSVTAVSAEDEEGRVVARFEFNSRKSGM